MGAASSTAVDVKTKVRTFRDSVELAEWYELELPDGRPVFLLGEDHFRTTHDDAFKKNLEALTRDCGMKVSVYLEGQSCTNDIAPLLMSPPAYAGNLESVRPAEEPPEEEKCNARIISDEYRLTAIMANLERIRNGCRLGTPAEGGAPMEAFERVCQTDLAVRTAYNYNMAMLNALGLIPLDEALRSVREDIGRRHYAPLPAHLDVWSEGNVLNIGVLKGTSESHWKSPPTGYEAAADRYVEDAWNYVAGSMVEVTELMRAIEMWLYDSNAIIFYGGYYHAKVLNDILTAMGAKAVAASTTVGERGAAASAAASAASMPKAGASD